jgi:hypothetical protein
MRIVIQMPRHDDKERQAAAMDALTRRTKRTLEARFTESPDYDPERVDVFGFDRDTKGVGFKTWIRWTHQVRVALVRLEARQHAARLEYETRKNAMTW